MIKEWRLPAALGGHLVDTKSHVPGKLGWYAVRIPGMSCDIHVQGECLEADVPPEPAARSLVMCRNPSSPPGYFHRLSAGTGAMWHGFVSMADHTAGRTWVNLHKDFETVTVLIDAGANDLEDDPFHDVSPGGTKISMERDESGLYLSVGSSQIILREKLALKIATRILGDQLSRS